MSGNFVEISGKCQGTLNPSMRRHPERVLDEHINFENFFPSIFFRDIAVFSKYGNYGSNDNRKGDIRKLKPNLAPNDVPCLLSYICKKTGSSPNKM